MNHTIAELFRYLTSGVYVIGVADDEHRNAFTAAWVMQISFDPLLIAFSINPDHASFPLLKKGGTFSVNVLKSDQLALARHFGTRSGRDMDKLQNIAWRPGSHGAPVLLDTLAYLDCRLTNRISTGDHALVVGEVMAGGILDPKATPLMYADTGDMDGSSALYPDCFTVEF